MFLYEDITTSVDISTGLEQVAIGSGVVFPLLIKWGAILFFGCYCCISKCTQKGNKRFFLFLG